MKKSSQFIIRQVLVTQKRTELIDLAIKGLGKISLSMGGGVGVGEEWG